MTFTKTEQQAIDAYYNSIIELEKAFIIDHHAGDVLSADFTELIEELTED